MRRGYDNDWDDSGKVKPIYSSLKITTPGIELVLTCPRFRIGGRLWSQSGRVSKIILAQLGKISPKASAWDMIMALGKWRMTIKNKPSSLG